MRLTILSLLLVLASCTELLPYVEQLPPTCQAELFYTGSHSTMLVYENPFDSFSDAIGGVSGSCRAEDCLGPLAVVGQLRDSEVWYQVIYNGQPAWLDIRDDARLVGQCNALPQIEFDQ